MRIVSKSFVPLEQSLGWFHLNSPYVQDWWLKLKILYLYTPWPWRMFEQEVLKAFINPLFLQSSVYVRWEFKEVCYYLHHLVILFLRIISISIVASYVCSIQPHSFALLSCLYLLAYKRTSFGICSYVVTYFHIVLVKPVSYFINL